MWHNDCEFLFTDIQPQHLKTILTAILATNSLLTLNTMYARLRALCEGPPGWAGTRKVKPIWIWLKQETVSGSGISWAKCKSAPRSRQITTPEPHHSVFAGRMPFLPPNQQRQSTEGSNTTATQISVFQYPLYNYHWCQPGCSSKQTGNKVAEAMNWTSDNRNSELQANNATTEIMLPFWVNFVEQRWVSTCRALTLFSFWSLPKQCSLSDM